MNDRPLPRRAAVSLFERLQVMPVVVLTGARQTGKSTLAQDLGAGSRRYLSLDDLDVLTLAREDPDALLGGEKPITLDEVQRQPDLLSAVKRAVDRRKEPGRFLLTGSANLALMRRVSETLAGRAAYLNLWPMTRREQLGLGACGDWDLLIDDPPAEWIDGLEDSGAGDIDWRTHARVGGFPTPAIELSAARERAIWFDGYIRTYLERDLQQLANISALPDFRRLMRAASLRLGQMINQSDTGRDIALPQPTVHRYLNLLETSYLLLKLPAYAVNRTKRLIKSPKLYWGDTGVALHLAGSSEPEGAHLENLVLNDLLVWRDTRLDRPELFYWRTTTGEEVDFVVEVEDRLLPIEVKSTARPRLSDARHLRVFLAEYGDRAPAGLLIHTGEEIAWLTGDVLAVPWWRTL